MELNVTQAAISKYELGLSEPDITMLKNIANYFKVSVDYIIGLSDEPVFLGSDISPEEAILLNKFRSLTPFQKEKAEAYIRGLLQE